MPGWEAMIGQPRTAMIGAHFETAYFSTQPLISWLLNTHVYGDRHYVFASRYFYPYRLPNPKSSNPHRIFSDLYEPAVDEDLYDKYIEQTRVGLRRGAVRNASGPNSRIVGPSLASIRRICDSVSPGLFWPVVYVIDATAAARGRPAGSAGVGSDEVLISDLTGDEFTVHAPDLGRLLARFPGLNRLVTGPVEPQVDHTIRILLEWSSGEDADAHS